MDLRIFGILAMVMVGSGWTIFGYLMGKAPKLKLDITGFLFICTAVEFIISIIIALFSGVPQATLTGWVIGSGILLLCGVANYFQLEIMAKAMQKGPNGIIWTITQSGFIFPFAMGIICFGVPLPPFRGVGFILLIASLVIFGLSGKSSQASGKWKLLALLAFLATGVSQSLSNLPSYFESAAPITEKWRTAAFALGLMLGCLLVKCRELPAFFRVVKEQLGNKNVWWMGALGSLSNMIFSMLFLYPGMNALEKTGCGAIAYPVMVCSCLIIFESYSIIFLREKRSAGQIFALILCIAGAVMIC